MTSPKAVRTKLSLPVERRHLLTYEKNCLGFVFKDTVAAGPFAMCERSNGQAADATTQVIVIGLQKT
jgi:hypothetical protein